MTRSGPALTHADRRALRRKAFWLSLALWGMIFAFLAYLDGPLGGTRLPVGRLWLVRLIWMGTGLGIGWVTYRFLEALLERSRLSPVAGLALLIVPFGSVHTVLNTQTFMALTGAELTWPVQLFSILYWLHFQFAWGILVLTLVLEAQTRAERDLRINAQREAHAAELEALRFQIHPHFLFNALNAVSALLAEGRYHAAEHTVRRLGAFLRRGLTRDTLADVTLAEEAADIETYLDVERARFEGRFGFECRIDEAAMHAAVPNFLLQPIVENAVRYGVARSQEPVTIRLDCKRDGDSVLVTIADDGPGSLEPGKGGLGTGERNVRQRLEARYGEGVSFRVDDRPASGRGYSVSMRFPFEVLA